MTMKNTIWLYLLLATLIGSACQKEEAIIEPELNKQPTSETSFGDFSLEVLHLSDHIAEICWTGNPSTGRYDAYLDGVLVKTGEVKHEFAQCVLSNLSPEQTYHVKIRWICSDDEVRFAETSFTTLPTFMLGYAGAVDVESYKYADYSCLNMAPIDNGLLYTLETKKDYSPFTGITLLKSDVEGNTVWTKDYPLYVDEKFSEYRDTELLADGSILLITTKRIICTAANGQTKWMHEFFEPEEKKISLNDAYALDNGNMLVVGSSQREWGKNDALWEEAYVALLSSDGKILNETYHDIKKFNRLERIEPMANGTFLVCGVSTEESEWFADGDFCVYKIDASGNILNVQQYPDFWYLQLKTSLKDDEGNFYFLGKERNLIGYVDTKISLIRMDAEGNITHQNYYDRRAGDGALEPVNMWLQDNHLIILSNDNKGTNVLITDKEGNTINHWGSANSFVYAEYEAPFMYCLDSYGYLQVYNLNGYMEYPYVSLMSNP